MRVPGPAKGAARIVLAAHVSADTYAATGGVLALNAAESMVAVLLMAKETAAANNSTGDLLAPGGRDTNFMLLPLTCWWRRG